MARPRVTHLFSTFRNMGGAEAVLRGHWRRDADYGIDSSFISYFEGPEPPLERVAFLGFNGKTNFGVARKKFACAISQQKPDICFYHGLWGIKFFMDIDAAQRRVFMIHGNPPHYPQMLAGCQRWADAFAAVSKPQYDRTLQCLPELGPERIARLHCPFFAPPDEPTHAPLANRPFVIGYCGRVTVHEKRADRAPALVKELEASGLNYRMEFLGDGDLEPELRHQLSNNPRVHFHGRKSGEEYWKALRAWDAFILFSDTEGTPITILETMHEGVLPIMPGINSGADYFAKLLGSEFVYTPYNFHEVASAIRSLQSRSEKEISALRQKARELVTEHRPENYFKAYSNFIHQTLTLPRRSTNAVPSRPWPINSLSFSTLDRLSRIRPKLGS
jgi:glycosyltransferase involved in cell wall biosynthesis